MPKDFRPRSLTIYDVEALVAPPRHSACISYVRIFNGEIYNSRILFENPIRQRVGSRKTSEAEIISLPFAEGNSAILSKLYGLFAFLIWDSMIKRTFAGRVTCGKKPPYFANHKKDVTLASQVKSCTATAFPC